MIASRAARRSLCCWLLTVACALAACSPSPNRRQDGDPTGPLISADSPEAQARFEQARAALIAGDYTASRAALAALAADHPQDAVAPLVALYRGRAELGALRLSPSGQITSDAADEALRRAELHLGPLAERDEGLPRVRFAAQLYLALTFTLQGRVAPALTLLRSYPSASLGEAVLRLDDGPAWLLLTEALTQAKRPEDALIAAARLHEVRRKAQPEGEDAAATYALTRALTLAHHEISEQSLQLRFLTSEDPLLVGAAGWGLLQRYARVQVDEALRETLDEVHARAIVALAQLGAGAQLAELSALTAMMGEVRPLVVGAILPLSGPNQAVGMRALRGLLLAQQAYRGEGAPRLTLVLEDAALGQPDERVRLLAEQGAMALIGPLDRTQSAAYQQAAARAGLPLMLLTTEPLARPGEGAAAGAGWSFRHFVDAEAEAEAVAAIARDQLKDQRVAILAPDMAYGKAMSARFAAAFQARGGQVVLTVDYDRKSNDYTALARRVAQAKPDVIFLPDTPDKVSQVSAFLAREEVWGVAQSVRPGLNAKRLQVHYLGTSLWLDPSLITQAGSYVRGAIIPAWYSEALGSAQVREFAARFQEVFRGTPSVYEAFAFDAMTWLRHAILTQGARRPMQVRDALMAAPLEGLTGQARFQPWGEPDRRVRFVQVGAAGFEPVPFSHQVQASGR